ncbi:hypothetical protein EJ02DRAFT_434643 [Clathrospora elynae]|uniref:Uncharacterized protein n=1 Tax=Clathrospora elynae TaxID=706981 RepID=A0A6A5SPK6_9PLEO|nr:hypothetical protein EJ02DRAFT_434643 [Clathrospora elynae]
MKSTFIISALALASTAVIVTPAAPAYDKTTSDRLTQRLASKAHANEAPVTTPALLEPRDASSPNNAAPLDWDRIRNHVKSHMVHGHANILPRAAPTSSSAHHPFATLHTIDYQNGKHMVVGCGASPSSSSTHQPSSSPVAHHTIDYGNGRHMVVAAKRAANPATMNPTLLSLLAVLQTAMPDTPLPTGTGTSVEDTNWYKNLPADVKSALCEFYPAPPTVTPAAEEEKKTTTKAPTTVCTRNVTITRTLQYTSTATGSGSFNGSAVYPTGSTNATYGTPTPSATPSPFTSSAGGRGKAVAAAIAWVGIGVGFFLFA